MRRSANSIDSAFALVLLRDICYSFIIISGLIILALLGHAADLINGKDCRHWFHAIKFEMENRGYEDEPNKSSRHSRHIHQQHQQQLLHPQHLQLHQQQQQRPLSFIGSNMHNHYPNLQDLHYTPTAPTASVHQPQHQQQQQKREQQQQQRHPHNHFVPIKFDPYRGMEHVYEDIVSPYTLDPGGGGGFHRNLTLPLRRTSQSCESLEGQSSSVRVTSRERTRGSVIDRLTREERNCVDDDAEEEEEGGGGSASSLGSGSNATDRRRRRKKDCRHCNKQQRVYEEREAELRAIFAGQPGVVYAIGCTATDCNTSLVSGNGLAPPDDKALIGPPVKANGATRAAGMKVNSIYAQDHWQHKDPRIFLGADPKEQDSPFQRGYSAVSATSPSSENRANLRRSVRDDPAPHPARLRKHRHGWTLYFGRPLSGKSCTKSLVLLLIVVLALLGIGGIALYIVFEPEKLHVIQQYLRSSARNSTLGKNNSNLAAPGDSLQDLEEPVFSTSLPPSSFLDALLNATVSSINSNNVPGGDSNDLDEPVFISAWPRPSTTSTTISTSITTINISNSSVLSATTRTTTTAMSTTTPRSATSKFLEATRRRPCNECRGEEVCVARNADETPFCRAPLNPHDSHGCGGLCDHNNQKCHKLDAPGAFRCTEMEHHCLDGEWTCHNIFCIPLVKRCDGQMNCYDHSDEYNCETHFHCGNETSCLPLSKKCDGHVDCFDATDEENCTTSHDLGRLCPSKDEFTCRSKQQCIKRSRFCDGYRDCKDGSDEPHGCQGRCNKHEFACHNGRCINKLDKCNGIDDCGDGSDEQHCRERL
ncbi:uncharacterized protein LOC131669803 isoform X2 [Phymastichus coffea]|uniref:uncharacterized protein LOC131669803 isoform X2 n=1 Tax=Phymastichus coffea TaxID=108790 RepID=UPI00273C368C|nr:uncharacterized protein LOC131669803 isoform X2 [Phymastichus coffea]